MKKTISIIIPVYNEEKTIKSLLEKVVAVDIPFNKEIICVDDGSTDNSAKIIKNFAKTHKNIHYFYKKNGGKGSAVRYGLKKSIGDIFIIQDADLEYDPNDYCKLLAEIFNGYEVVYGSRYLSEKGNLKENNHITFQLHRIGNKFLSFLTTLMYFRYISDMETCYKVFTKNALEKIAPLKANKFDFEPEITSKFLKKGIRIKEVPIKYYSRDFNEGKKITWKDGIKAAYYLIYYRFFD